MAGKTRTRRDNRGLSPWQRMKRDAKVARTEAVERAKRRYKTDKPTSKQIDACTKGAARWMLAFNDYSESLGGALGQLPELSHDVIGREQEIDMLYAVLERPKTPVACLLGNAGEGKTSMVEEFVKRASQDNIRINGEPRHYMLIALRLGQLAALEAGRLQAELAKLLNNLAQLERNAQAALNDRNLRIVLFIDEVHMLVTIFGPGTKIGGDIMKDMLARSPIRIVAATTRREYDSTIAVDKPLAERFKQIELRPLTPDTVLGICKNWWERNAPDCPPVEDDVFRYIIKSNAAYRPDSAEPRKSLDILEDLVSYCRRTGKPATREFVGQVFSERFSISLGFNIDADIVMDNIHRRVFGQTAATEALDLLLHATAFKVEQNENKPIFTCLMTGPTGCGKTETTKAIAEALYPNESTVIKHFNMPDYGLDEAEPRFRLQLGETLRHQPNAVILLDEFEKAAPTLRNSMLQILDEGIVNFTVLNREGREETNRSSLRDAIVIATTNAGADIFADDNKFNRRTGGAGKGAERFEHDAAYTASLERLLVTLRENLQKNGFSPEMLGRFDQIIPYRALSEDTSLKILDKRLMEMIDGLEVMHGVRVQPNPKVMWDSEQYDCYARDVIVYVAFEKARIGDSNSGGARALSAQLEQAVFYQIVRAKQENPDCNDFTMRVDGVYDIVNENGDKIYKIDRERKGGVIVEPVVNDNANSDEVA